MAHAFVADLGEELEFLSIGERKDNDVVIYPDSGKVLVACVADENGECRDVVGRLQEADYFDGEPKRPTQPYSPECVDGVSLLKNSFAR